jgi:hypothetical protein
MGFFTSPPLGNGNEASTIRWEKLLQETALIKYMRHKIKMQILF